MVEGCYRQPILCGGECFGPHSARLSKHVLNNNETVHVKRQTNSNADSNPMSTSPTTAALGGPCEWRADSLVYVECRLELLGLWGRS